MGRAKPIRPRRARCASGRRSSAQRAAGVRVASAAMGMAAPYCSSGALWRRAARGVIFVASIVYPGARSARRAKRVSRYDLNTPPVPGVACLPLETQASTLRECTSRCSASTCSCSTRAAYGRTQRWMCSWLYKLRACDDAERAQKRSRHRSARAAAGRKSPDEQSEGLGWRGYKVNAMIDLAPLLYGFLCW